MQLERLEMFTLVFTFIHKIAFIKVSAYRNSGWEPATFFPTPPPLSWIYQTEDRYCSNSSPICKLFLCSSVFLLSAWSVFIHPSLPGLLFSFHVSSFPTRPPADGASRSSSQTDWENWSVRTQPYWLRLVYWTTEACHRCCYAAFVFSAWLPKPTHWSLGDKTGSAHWHT